MGGRGVGLDSGGGSRGASLGGLGIRAMFGLSFLSALCRSAAGPGRLLEALAMERTPELLVTRKKEGVPAVPLGRQN